MTAIDGDTAKVAELVKEGTPSKPQEVLTGKSLERRLIWLTVGELEYLIAAERDKGEDADSITLGKLRKALPPTHGDYLPRWPVDADGDAA